MTIQEIDDATADVVHWFKAQAADLQRYAPIIAAAHVVFLISAAPAASNDVWSLWARSWSSPMTALVVLVALIIVIPGGFMAVVVGVRPQVAFLLSGIAASLVAWLFVPTWVWGTAPALTLVCYAVSDGQRSKARTLRKIRADLIAAAPKADDEQLDVGATIGGVRWEGFWAPRLKMIRLGLPPTVALSKTTVRKMVLDSVEWAMIGAPRKGADSEDHDSDMTTSEWVAERGELVVRAVPPLPRLLEGTDELLTHTDGVVLGQRPPARGVAMSQTSAKPIPLVVLDLEREMHILIAGGTGGGKTSLQCALVASAVLGGHVPGGVDIIDGKAAGDYVFLARKFPGQVRVASRKNEWAAAVARVTSDMEAIYEARLAAKEAGRAVPATQRRIVIIDEMPELVKAGLGDALTSLSTLVRAAGATLMTSTQRPDVATFGSGTARDQYKIRIILGPMQSLVGASMMLADEEDQRQAMKMPEIPGRIMVAVDGETTVCQVPLVPEMRRDYKPAQSAAQRDDTTPDDAHQDDRPTPDPEPAPAPVSDVDEPPVTGTDPAPAKPEKPAPSIPTRTVIDL